MFPDEVFMTTYTIISDVDTYDALVLANPNDWDKLDKFTGERLADTWTPVAVKTLKVKKAGDFLYLIHHVPVFSERAWQVLQPLVKDSVEALPLKHPKKIFYAINVLVLVDCLDYSRSQIERFPSGGIMEIERYVFKDGCVEGKHIFKVAEAPLKRVLVSEKFKELVEKNRLEGLIFSKVG
jgi:hypothetical protein